MKRTILVAVLLVTCILSATVGGTVAWFTDSVSTGINTIEVGNLDIELYNGETKVDETTTNLFTYPTLWEPGAVAYANLSVKNVGTLALQYSMALDTTDRNYVIENNQNNGLSLVDVLKVAILEKAIETTDSRADVLDKAKAASPVALNSFTMQGELEEKDETAVCTMVVYWPDDNSNETDNQFNLNNGKTSSDGKPLYINLGIKLDATQLIAESDSFGNDYDANASFWSGAAGEADDAPEIDDATNTVIIANAADLANFAASVNAGKNYEGVTVSLTSNINLAGNAWTPIGNTQSSSFSGIFNGNGHTISGLKLNTQPEYGYVGLFGRIVNATIENLIIDGAEIHAQTKNSIGVVVGNAFTGSKIDKVIVTNASVEGNRQIGGIVGSTYSSVTNCTVKNSTFIAVPDKLTGSNDNGDKVGGIVGLVPTDTGAVSISGNTVENVTLKGYRDIGGIAGGTNASVLSSNTVKNTTIEIDQKTNYYEDKAANAAEIIGRIDKGNVADTNTADDVTITVATVVSNNEGLVAAINSAQSGDTVVLNKGEYSLPSLANTEGLTIEGAADGSTVIGGENATTGFNSNFGKDTTIKNLTFSGSDNGVRWSYAKGGTSTFEDCTFAGDSTYGFHIDQSNGATFIFNNCTFSGFNAFAGDLVKVTFNNCTFLNNGSYGHTNIWSVGKFNNCTFGEGVTYGIRDNGVIYIDGVLQQ